VKKNEKRSMHGKEMSEGFGGEKIRGEKMWDAHQEILPLKGDAKGVAER